MYCWSEYQIIFSRELDSSRANAVIFFMNSVSVSLLARNNHFTKVIQYTF